MENVLHKSTKRSITRINHAYRRGQYQVFNFKNIGTDLYILKTGYSRVNEPNTDVMFLNDRYTTAVEGETFDSFYARMRLVYYIYKENDTWTSCTCPYYYMHAVSTSFDLRNTFYEFR